MESIFLAMDFFFLFPVNDGLQLADDTLRKDVFKDT